MRRSGVLFGNPREMLLEALTELRADVFCVPLGVSRNEPAKLKEEADPMLQRRGHMRPFPNACGMRRNVGNAHAYKTAVRKTKKGF